MKKTINIFFEEAPYWQLIIVLFILSSVLVFSFSLLVSYKLNFSVNIIILKKLSLIIGLIFSFFGTLLIYIERRSVVFWKESKKITSKIDKANDKSSLNKILDNDFQKLKKMSFGTHHYIEINRIYAIIETKCKYMK